MALTILKPAITESRKEDLEKSFNDLTTYIQESDGFINITHF
jgi:hypothetical protein